MQEKPKTKRSPVQKKGAVTSGKQVEGWEGRQKIIVVIGMHRSGSSVVTRGIAAIGADLGEDLIATLSEENPKGFFEDVDIQNLNEELLGKLNSRWHSLADLDTDKLVGPEFSSERRRAAVLLDSKLKTAEIFCFKDPRTTILLPFWQCIFEDLELDDRYVITVRNPIDVADSLQKRGGVSIKKGVHLWSKYMISAIKWTQLKPRLFVGFEGILETPVPQLQRIADKLEIPLTEEHEQAMNQYGEEFLEKTLRHNFSGPRELERSGVAPEYVIELYSHLRSLCSELDDRRDGIDEDVWFSIEERHRNTERALRLVEDYDFDRKNAIERANLYEVKVKELSREVDKAKSESEEHSKIRKELASLRASNDAEIGVLRETVEQQLQDIERLERTAISATEQTEIANKTINAMQEKSRAQDQLVTDTQKKLGELEAQNRELHQENNELNSALENRQENLESLKAENQKALESFREKSEQSLSELRAELKKQQAQSTFKDTEMRQIAENLKNRSKEYLLAKSELNRVHTSWSWRITKPVRFGIRLVRKLTPSAKARNASRFDAR